MILYDVDLIWFDLTGYMALISGIIYTLYIYICLGIWVSAATAIGRVLMLCFRKPLPFLSLIWFSLIWLWSELDLIWFWFWFELTGPWCQPTFAEERVLLLRQQWAGCNEAVLPTVHTQHSPLLVCTRHVHRRHKRKTKYIYHD